MHAIGTGDAVGKKQHSARHLAIPPYNPTANTKVPTPLRHACGRRDDRGGAMRDAVRASNA